MPTKQQIEQAEWFAAFDDASRLMILQILATGEKTVTEIARLCQIEIVNVSHHLGALRSAGVVTGVRDGRFICYSLAGASTKGGLLVLTHASGATISIPLE